MRSILLAVRNPVPHPVILSDGRTAKVHATWRRDVIEDVGKGWINTGAIRPRKRSQFAGTSVETRGIKNVALGLVAFDRNWLIKRCAKTLHNQTGDNPGQFITEEDAATRIVGVYRCTIEPFIAKSRVPHEIPLYGAWRPRKSARSSPPQGRMVRMRGKLPTFDRPVLSENRFLRRTALSIDRQNVIGAAGEFLKLRIEWELPVHFNKSKIVTQIDLFEEIVAVIVIIDVPCLVHLLGHMPGGERPSWSDRDRIYGPEIDN